MISDPLCRCGHVRSTHHEGRHNCLAVLCECKTYLDRRDPEIVTRPAHHPLACRCYECKRALGEP